MIFGKRNSTSLLWVMICAESNERFRLQKIKKLKKCRCVQEMVPAMSVETGCIYNLFFLVFFVHRLIKFHLKIHFMIYFISYINNICSIYWMSSNIEYCL
uniref:Uncharacterized protein n=1 Tax=Anguilla anguilla TaxID=7936 RepID=A0A0E9WL83_ANGAN